MGSKARLAKEILPIILNGRTQDQWYVEPFAGGMNIIDKVTGNRLANDINVYLIAMWIEILNGWVPPKTVTKDQYLLAKQGKCSDYERGYIGFNCSYSGKWFGGYAGVVNTKEGIRDYQSEAFNNVMEQAKSMIGVAFSSCQYKNLLIPEGSIIYCDPPYAGTTGYKDKFNNEEFFDWCRQKSTTNKIFISEYSAPEDFTCVWEKEVKSSLSANGKIGGSKISIERLFTYHA